MTSVHLSIGSNIERETNIKSAIHHLQKLFSPLTVSCVYQSKAVGFDGADFYNLVVGFDTTFSLDQIHDCLRGIEEAHGRKRGTSKYSSRPLDIDLLLFGDTVRHTEHIDVPRGEIGRYAFVLLPLSEIAHDIMHPETAQTIGEMWSNFDAVDQPIHRIQFEF